MRIVIEPTDMMREKQHRVVIEDPRDDQDIWELATLLKGAVVAYGYHPDNVALIINTEEEDPFENLPCS